MDTKILICYSLKKLVFGIELLQNLAIRFINIWKDSWKVKNNNIKFKITTANYKLVVFVYNSELEAVTILHIYHFKNFYTLTKLNNYSDYLNAQRNRG